AAGVVPGLLLAVLICAYIFIRCALQPELGPSLPREERGRWPEKIAALRAVLLHRRMVLKVLGSIMLGLATPSGAAAIGVLGARIAELVYSKLSWALLRESCIRTLRLTGMTMSILFAALAFSSAYQSMGAKSLIK